MSAVPVISAEHQQKLDQAIDQIVHHKLIQHDPLVRTTFKSNLDLFVSESSKKDVILPADPHAILASYKESNFYANSDGKTQKVIDGVLNDLQAKAQAGAESKPGVVDKVKEVAGNVVAAMDGDFVGAPSDKAGNAKPQQLVQGVKQAVPVKLQQMDGQADTQAGFVQQIAPQAQQQGAQQQVPQTVTAGGVLMGAIMRKLSGANKPEPGPTAQALDAAQDKAGISRSPTDVADSAFAKLKEGCKRLVTLGEEPPDSVKAKAAMNDYMSALHDTGNAIADENRHITNQLALGKMDPDQANDHLKGRAKDLDEINEEVGKSGVGAKNKDFMDAANDKTKNIQEAIKAMMDNIKKGLETLFDYFTGKDKKAGASAPKPPGN